jgi:hypothetical protein
MTGPDSPFFRIEQRLRRGELIVASREIDDWTRPHHEDAGALTQTLHAGVRQALGPVCKIRWSFMESR